MKRILVLTLAAGAVTAIGIGFGMHTGVAGQNGDGYGHARGSFNAGGHGRGHGMGGRGMRGRGMHRMMRSFDADKDGKLTQDEINSGRSALVTKHDADGNGQLTLAEYQKLWLEMRRRRMVRSFQRMDEDGDAVITTEEFLEPFARMVERMDSNEDGVLDKQDHKRHHGMRRPGGNGGKFGMGRRRMGQEPAGSETEGEATEQ